MSSRAEEKERRRQERLAAEQAAARAGARRRLLRRGPVAAGALVLIVVVAIAVLAGGNSGGADAKELAKSAGAADCTLRSFKSEGRLHTKGNEKVTYKTNPPTSGNHNPVPAPDGIYSPGNEPEKENWVHTLEHGRVIFQYKPGSSKADVQKLRALVSEKFKGTAGYHELLLQNNTDMPANFAAVAWTHSLTCSSLTAKSLEALRDFRDVYVDKAPEVRP